MVFSVLVANVLPLYGLILLGFIVGRGVKLDVQPIATIMLYAVLPIVMFGATGNMEFTPAYFLPPLIIASISIVASGAAYLVSARVWPDKRHNLLGLLSTGGNATYFGLPIALALFGAEWLSVFILMVLPLFIVECTLGYYYAVRGESSIKDSLVRVAKLPIIHGALLGLLVNFVGFDLPNLFNEYWMRFTNTTIILGMMMIGAALARIENFRFDWAFFTGVAAVRYILWPVLGFAWVALDVLYLHMLPSTVHSMLILVCACPLAANNVAYAARLNLHPALTAAMVLVTTLLALGFIPFMLMLKEGLF